MYKHYYNNFYFFFFLEDQGVNSTKLDFFHNVWVSIMISSQNFDFIFEDHWKETKNEKNELFATVLINVDFS